MITVGLGPKLAYYNPIVFVCLIDLYEESRGFDPARSCTVLSFESFPSLLCSAVVLFPSPTPHPQASTAFVIVGDNNVQVQHAIADGSYNVVDCRWLFECIDRKAYEFPSMYYVSEVRTREIACCDERGPALTTTEHERADLRSNHAQKSQFVPVSPKGLAWSRDRQMLRIDAIFKRTGVSPLFTDRFLFSSLPLFVSASRDLSADSKDAGEL